MRYTRMRFDIWLCLLIAVGVSFGTKWVAEQLLPAAYENYEAEHTVDDGDIGGRAGADVFRARSVDDILNHDTFTIVSDGIEYRNRGGGYLGGRYMHAVTLPSGERVAAYINMENVQVDGEYYSGVHTLPVGRVVYEDLAAGENFLSQIKYAEPLSRHDFYIDMVGQGGKASQESYTEHYTAIVQVITVVICFPVLHSVGAKLGLFPFFFAPRRKKGEEEQKGEWD